MFFTSLILALLVTSTVWSAEPSTQRINVDKSDGLVRIDKDGAYIYADTRTKKSQSGHLHLGQANQPDISIDINGVTYHFEDFYDSPTGLTIGYDYEYYFTNTAGKLGIQVGGAVQYTQGHGRLVQNPPAESIPSVESFSFATLPLFIGGVYRFEYTIRQWLAPYVAGGGVIVGLVEKREDSSKLNYTGGLGFYGTAGALLNVSILDRETALTLDSEYGIGNLWINLEFKYINVSAESFRYENSYLQGGVSFDF